MDTLYICLPVSSWYPSLSLNKMGKRILYKNIFMITVQIHYFTHEADTRDK
jgi:hypothetical protein